MNLRTIGTICALFAFRFAVSAQGACGELTLEDLSRAEQCIARFASHGDCDSLKESLQIRMLAIRQLQPERGSTIDPLEDIDLSNCPDIETNADWWFGLGMFHMELGEFASAERALGITNSLASWPENRGKARIMMAICSTELGNQEKALELVRSAIGQWDHVEIPPLYCLNMSFVLQAAHWHHTALNWLLFALDREASSPTTDVPGLEDALAAGILHSSYHASRCDVAAWIGQHLELSRIEWTSSEKHLILKWMERECGMLLPGMSTQISLTDESKSENAVGAVDSTVVITIPQSINTEHSAASIFWIALCPWAFIIVFSIRQLTRNKRKTETLDQCFQHLHLLIENEAPRSQVAEKLHQVEQMLGATWPNVWPESSDINQLSDREKEVLELAVSGMVPKQIAAELALSPKYVYNIFSALRQKLGLDRKKNLENLFDESSAQDN